MPSFPRPPRTLIPGLGVAGAVLAAIVAAFAVASGVIAYNFTNVDPLPRPSGALVLDSRPTGAAVAAKPLVLRPAQASTSRRRPAARAGVARFAVASVRGRETAAGGLSPSAGRGPAAAAEPQRAGDADRPAAPAQPAPAHVLQPVGDAIGATGHAVGAATDAVAGRLDTVTADIGARTEPVATIVGAVAGATTDALRTTVDRSGKVVGRLLGTPQR